MVNLYRLAHISHKLIFIAFHFFSQEFLSGVRKSWQQPNHPNVARILAACTQGDPLCVVSEWVMSGDGFNGGDLHEFLKQHIHSSTLAIGNGKLHSSNSGVLPSGFVDVHNTSASSKSSSILTVTTASSSPGSSSATSPGIR